ncbi:ABC transporter-like protein [Perkinsela sp. CCAP 1560/4]|nr:ABC transporter-like protein [Perkinsela sp. CCAP 1560/4]|eukprot:KNH09562.1 ABC transporter-like protein [Perkinsela sp. CCAP 1560/4]
MSGCDKTNENSMAHGLEEIVDRLRCKLIHIPHPHSVLLSPVRVCECGPDMENQDHQEISQSSQSNLCSSGASGGVDTTNNSVFALDERISDFHTSKDVQLETFQNTRLDLIHQVSAKLRSKLRDEQFNVSRLTVELRQQEAVLQDMSNEMLSLSVIESQSNQKLKHKKCHENALLKELNLLNEWKKTAAVAIQNAEQEKENLQQQASTLKRFSLIREFSSMEAKNKSLQYKCVNQANLIAYFQSIIQTQKENIERRLKRKNIVEVTQPDLSRGASVTTEEILSGHMQTYTQLLSAIGKVGDTLQRRGDLTGRVIRNHLEFIHGKMENGLCGQYPSFICSVEKRGSKQRVESMEQKNSQFPLIKMILEAGLLISQRKDQNAKLSTLFEATSTSKAMDSLDAEDKELNEKKNSAACVKKEIERTTQLLNQLRSEHANLVRIHDGMTHKLRLCEMDTTYLRKNVQTLREDIARYGDVELEINMPVQQKNTTTSPPRDFSKRVAPSSRCNLRSTPLDKDFPVCGKKPSHCSASALHEADYPAGRDSSISSSAVIPTADTSHTAPVRTDKPKRRRILTIPLSIETLEESPSEAIHQGSQ